MSPCVGLVVFIAIFALFGAQEKPSLVERTHQSLERALNFVHDDYRQINLDCLYGIVLAHGFLKNILKKNLAERDLIVITSYIEKIEKIVPLVQPVLLNDSATNKAFVENLINLKRWYRKVTFQENVIDPNFQLNKSISSKDDFLKFESMSNFDERRSDECFMDIVSSGSFEVPHNCTVNKWCAKNMILNEKISPAYVVTHRLLLLQIARSQKCIFNEKQYNKKVRSYCSYIYWEVRQNQMFGFIRALDDLFMEEVTLCGAEGFGEFVRKELIEHVLSIENEHGCFSVKLMERRSRVKRSANYIKYGCNDHSTGLGISAMSLFLLSLYQSGETL